MHLAPSARGVSRPERFWIIELIEAKLPALPSGAAYCCHLTPARIHQFHYVLPKKPGSEAIYFMDNRLPTPCCHAACLW